MPLFAARCYRKKQPWYFAIAASSAVNPRPALLLHPSDLFGTEIPLPICLITSRAVEAPLLRIPLPADQTTGLQVPSWAAIDLMMTIRRRRIGQRIGQIDRDTMIFIDRALLVFLGLA